jgi:hypothetical protein
MAGEPVPDPIALQVDQDLLSLTEFPLGPASAAEAVTSTHGPPAEPVAGTAPNIRPPELAAAVLTEWSDARHPVPSMWEPQERERASAATTSGADSQPPPIPAASTALATLPPSSAMAAQVIATTMAPVPRAERSPPQQQTGDLLAALMALSEEERIALFT